MTLKKLQITNMENNNGYNCRFCGNEVIDFNHMCDKKGINYWVKKERKAENLKNRTE